MSHHSIDYSYRYLASSAISRTATDSALKLATSSPGLASPYFFQGLLIQPKVISRMLLALSEVVATRYFMPTPSSVLFDPVVTSSDAVLRFEGMSGCCGVYVRVDLEQAGFDAQFHSRGTTNVDFNSPMRRALARIGEGESVRLCVGSDELSLERSGDTIVEKKVALPVRWIKSFSEVQAYQPGMALKMEIAPRDAMTLLRSLPKASAAPKRPGYLVGVGRCVRMAADPRSGGVPVHGPHRLATLLSLIPFCDRLRVWADESTGVSGWEVMTEIGRYTLILSPEVHRAFSGEGQLLDALAEPAEQSLLATVRANLNWQSRIDVERLGQALGTPPAQLRLALKLLGTQGLAGYDLSSGSYFHRELPFGANLFEAQQPRIKAARAILEKHGVTLMERRTDGVALGIAGSGVEHQVFIGEDEESCTCPWYNRYRGERGVCKHILAARLFLQKEGRSLSGSDIIAKKGQSGRH